VAAVARSVALSGLVNPTQLHLRDSGLLKDADGQNRTLYSLRHTYATLELLRANTDIHTLAKQMGNSAAVIERHYSKLTATMAAERLSQ
jgi:integrase